MLGKGNKLLDELALHLYKVVMVILGEFNKVDMDLVYNFCELLV